MKRSLQCPKCSGRKLWAIAHVLQVEETGENADRVTTTPLGLTAARLGEGGSQWRVSTVGPLEAWACDGCGYTEFYARDFSNVLARLAADPKSGVCVVDAAGPPQGPHR